ARLRAEEKSRAERITGALRLLESVDAGSLKEKIDASTTTWLVAGLTSGLVQRHRAPACPADFAVLATDGSHIDVDRHSSVKCSLVNIGSVFLQYGENPDASLESRASLLFGDDLVVAGPAGREELVEGALLGLRRGVEELKALARLAQGLPRARAMVALVDGSLILWGVQAFREFVADELLGNGFLAALDAMKERRLALTSYISYPRSTDVVNALRVALCPHDPVDCDRQCSEERSRACDAVAGVRDRDLFGALLEEGERSPLFLTGSPFVHKHYGEHQIHFFYLKLDEEVARLEVPNWVAADEELVGQVHALVLDQCRRGHGYPVALMEAHEKAVVTAIDRERFWELIEMSLARDRMDITGSGKQQSKRLRWA
ncbi:MAG: DNA double-strand break repair nuclease NurA, partial [Chloroflexota bacterium]|nr:DNA double-strand break repair nuclease NurA [Chloroflexota bacterium]